ncbi:MAG: hypothetical protein EP329_19545 [Deltaproteobacteria bacterium]|nr:MAG: hypothetical protein EP329_19545 [Deltaproteobacteria bacterium]
MNVSRSFQLTLVTLGVVASLAACRTREIELSARYGSANSERLMAKAVLASTSGSTVTGELKLEQLVTENTEKHAAFPEVMAYAQVAGLEGGAYTLRLHDAASCDAPAAAGDVGPNARTLTPGADGTAKLTAALSKVTLAEGGLIGKSVVVHKGTAAEGAPVACGVIVKVEPPKEEHGHGGGEHATAHEGGEHGAEGHEAAPAHEGGEHGAEGHEAAPAHEGAGH